MPIGVNIKGDIKKATRFLTKVQKRQIPFATSLAINGTAKIVQANSKATMQKDLDNPTPATVKSVRVQYSSKRNLRAAVFIIPAVDKFLRYQIHGGTRSPRGRTEAVPVSIRLNKYGNIIGRKAGKLKKLLGRDDTFSGTIKGVAGIWQRGRGKMRNKTVKLLVAYESRTRYRPRWDFYKYALQAANRAWRKQFNIAMRRALR